MNQEGYNHIENVLRKNLNPLEFGKRSELTEKIRFLEEGKYGYGKGTKFFDFENLEELNALSDVDKLMLNIDTNYDPSKYLSKKNNGNNVKVVEMPGETIDLRGNNNGETNFAKSNVKATNVEIASSVDVNNRYVSEFPITAGFDDSVYT